MNTLLCRLTLAAAGGMAAVSTVSHAVMRVYMKVEGVRGNVQSTAEIGSFYWLGDLTPGGRFIGDPTVFDVFAEMGAVRGPDGTPFWPQRGA